MNYKEDEKQQPSEPEHAQPQQGRAEGRQSLQGPTTVDDHKSAAPAHGGRESTLVQRREFLKGSIVGGLTVFAGFDGSNTQEKLSHVRKEAEEELKQQGIVQPTEKEIQDALRNEDYTYGIGTKLKDHRTLEEVLKDKEESRATEDKAREYRWMVDDLVFRKAPILSIRSAGDTIGMLGGAIMIGKRLLNELRRK